MNLALSEEQELLQESARQALARFKTVEAARDVLDGGELPDLWPTAVEAGWTGLLASEEHGGAGLDLLDAMLVQVELGRVLAAVPLLGHLGATVVLDACGHGALEVLAGGEKRGAFVPARPPDDVHAGWTVDPRRGLTRAAAPVLDESGLLTGTVSFVPDAPGADVLVVAATLPDGTPVAALVEAGADVEAVRVYDGTRALGHVTFEGVPAERLPVGGDVLARAWDLTQALLAAELLGGVEQALVVSTQYAKERFTFGRAIGSYQAVKHELVEVLRRQENSRSLMLYAGWAAQDAPDELALAASAFRNAAGRAVEHASRAQISVHGGIGATWEHDAPYLFRRAQLARRLLGGTGDAAERVSAELLAKAASEPETPALG